MSLLSVILLSLGYVFIGYLIGFGHKYYIEAVRPEEIDFWNGFEYICLLSWPLVIIIWIIDKMGELIGSIGRWIASLNWPLLGKPLKWLIFEIFAPRSNVKKKVSE